jgi:hypothetical protein
MHVMIYNKREIIVACAPVDLHVVDGEIADDGVAVLARVLHSRLWAHRADLTPLLPERSCERGLCVRRALQRGSLIFVEAQQT